MPRLVAGALAVALLLGACGGESPDPPGTPPGPTTSAPTRTTGPPGKGEVTVGGTVQRGVEPGCLVLQAPDREYLLLGPTGDLRPGTEVVVRGRTDPGQATTCMQGLPLHVLDVRQAG